MSTTITRRAAVTGLAAAPVAVVANNTQAGDKRDPAVIDVVLTEAWEARAENRNEIDNWPGDVPKELTDEMVRIEDAILDILASAPPRTPTVIAVEAAMALCDGRRLADRVVTTPFAEMLVSRVEGIADQLTGRLRDDMAEVIAAPDKPYGLCRLCHCGGRAYVPADSIHRSVRPGNMVYRFECMLALGAWMLENEYPNARVKFRSRTGVYDKVTDTPGAFLPEGVIFHPELLIDGDDPQFHRDLAEWRELKARIRANQPDAAKPAHS